MKPFFSVQIIAKGQGHNRKCILVVGAHAHPLGALVGQRADIHIAAKGIPPHELEGDFAQLGRRAGNANAQDAAVPLPAFVVFDGTQHEQLLGSLVPIAANAFEYAGSVMQSVGEDAHARLAERDI